MGSKLALLSAGEQRYVFLTVYSGRDDFICIGGDDGSMRVWHNTPSSDDRSPVVRAGFLTLPIQNGL